MKKFIYAIAVALIASFANATTDPTVPGPENPYCNLAFSNFPLPPSIGCPEGQTVNASCIKECENAYQDALRKAYSNACSQYYGADQAYKKCTRAAVQVYDDCFAVAATQAEREVCRDTMLMSMNNCLTSLQTSRTIIAAKLSSAVSSAQATFYSCEFNCCY